jgi:CheY-like chemotaxis protein
MTSLPRNESNSSRDLLTVARVERELVGRTLGDVMSQRSVLVVDDDADCREAIADALYDEGYTVMMAREGRAALELLQAHEQPPDLMLLDIMMPELDGYELLSELSKSARLALIPTVLFSASDRPRMSWPNVRGFLHKPVRLEKLIDVVSNCMAESLRHAENDGDLSSHSTRAGTPE